MKNGLAYSLEQVCSVLPEQKTLIVDPSMSVQEALRAMAQANLRSLIIRNSDVYRSIIIDMRDIATLLHTQIEAFGGDIMMAVRSISGTPIVDVPRVRKGAVADYSIHLDTVMKYFEVSPRIIVVKDNAILRVLSAIDVIAVLKFNGKLDQLERMEELSFKCSNIRSSVAVAINEECTLNKTIETLAVTQFSALPIVTTDVPDRPVAVFSVRDIIPLFLNDPDLHPESGREPAIDYVSKLRQRQGSAARFPFIHVPESSSIQAAVSKIVSTGVHRVLLSDDRGKISGVLSVTDIIRVITKVLASSD
eukprot:GDKJ01044952.1.p1 GENE.GDKJ01044952.1~~GDKJ01044952.1.p1  ORF type:complete len:306 (+),score=86.47 GDKJ01044952.1:20-937(+)